MILGAPMSRTAQKPPFDASKERVDSRQIITDKIIEMLEKGVRPWTQPWTGGDSAFGAMPLRFDGKAYSGINVLILWMMAEERGYRSPFWMTMIQANKLGGVVRKGSKCTWVTKYAPAEIDAKDKNNNVIRDANGDVVRKQTAFLKVYQVFNAEQIEKLPERFYPKPASVEGETPKDKLERIAKVEEFFTATKSDVHYGGDRAYYNPEGDFIGMPRLEDFVDSASFYATLGHEHIHWTGAKKRLDREFGKRFGDKAYAFEELIAEMGSAFLCVKLGITMTPREDHAAYLAHWLGVLKSDKRAIFVAASAAQRAVDHLESLTTGKAVVHEPSEEVDEMKDAA